MRINKYLSAVGFCSRRAADKLLEQGKILIDGKVAVLGQEYEEGQLLTVDGKEIKSTIEDKKNVIYAMNKPVGILCTTSDKQGKNVLDIMNTDIRVYPVGRLDKDSEGLILLTNDGEAMEKILKAGTGHEKEYIVTVDKPIGDAFVKKMSNGIYLKALDRTTSKCFVKKIGTKKFKIILTQGLNRQIRRMCEECGYKVETLKRVRIMNIHLGDIKVGEYRELTQREYKELYKSL